MLIGLEILLITYMDGLSLSGFIAIAIAARLLTVDKPAARMREAFRLPRGAWKVLTWGGPRSGISVALALSLWPAQARDIIVALTYIVVVFSILAQGFTIGQVVRVSVAHTSGKSARQSRPPAACIGSVFLRHRSRLGCAPN